MPQSAVVLPERSEQRSTTITPGRRGGRADPEIPYVVLHTYVDKPRQADDEVVIHAMCAELWVGSQPIAMTQPQHTFGLPPRTVKEYARHLLEALYQRYGNGRWGGFERFAREEQHLISQCPVRPCSYHADHLQPVSGRSKR